MFLRIGLVRNEECSVIVSMLDGRLDRVASSRSRREIRVLCTNGLKIAFFLLTNDLEF